MKYQDEIESLRRQAKIMQDRTAGEGHHWAVGVEDALVWAQGNGTSDRMKQLEHDAAWRQEIQNAISSRVLEQARDLLGDEPTMDSVEGLAYARAIMEMVVKLTDFDDVEAERTVADLLGLDYDTVYPRPAGD